MRVLSPHRYQSSSPDENAIVKAARSMGFVFAERTPMAVTVHSVSLPT